MTGHNISVYLDSTQAWEHFQEACQAAGSRPNTVLRNFISQYTRQILKEKFPLEYQIAQGMVEAKQIAGKRVKAKKAYDLLKEI